MRFIPILAIILLCFAGCDDAEVVSHNISKAADNFEVNRRVVFYNGITGEYILTIEGRCSLQSGCYNANGGSSGNELEVIVKTGENQYKKHFLGLSDNVTYFAEQVDAVPASPYFYRVTFKPSVVVPDVNVR